MRGSCIQELPNQRRGKMHAHLKSGKGHGCAAVQSSKRTKEGSNPPGMSLTERLEPKWHAAEDSTKIKTQGKDKPLAIQDQT